MTHKELLNKIIHFKEMSDIGKQQKALRAVVELHEPDVDDDCSYCYGITNEYSYSIAYPCPTIQAIEKELK